MKKKYLIFFVVFVIVDILWVIIPNIKSIHSYRSSRKEMEVQLSKYDLAEKRQTEGGKDSEYYLFQLDEILQKYGIQIRSRNFSTTENGSIQLYLELSSSKNQLLDLLTSSEWSKGGYKILSINSEFDDNKNLNTTIEILIIGTE